MPIRPENRGKYPVDWPSIRERILQRADHKCEWCGVPNHAHGWRDSLGQFHRLGADRVADLNVPNHRVVKIVLTIAHLDRRLVDHSDANLAALCQKCHNDYDAQDRAAGRIRRRQHLYEAHQYQLPVDRTDPPANTNSGQPAADHKGECQ